MKYSRSSEEQHGKNAKSSVQSSAARMRRSTQHITHVNGRRAFTECGYQTKLVVALEVDNSLSEREVRMI